MRERTLGPLVGAPSVRSRFAFMRGAKHRGGRGLRGAGSRAYRGGMEYLRGPLYLDVAAKGLCFVGVAMMIFGQGGWFIGGVVAVVIGVLFGALSMVAVRRMRRRGWDGVTRVR